MSSQNPQKKSNVSIVIPTYNRKKKVLEAITSVFDQNIDNIEVIVVDDGSTDDTFSYLTSLALPIKILRKENGGVSQARNAGIDVATGTYIALLDSDDLWLPGKLKEQLEYFDSHPDIKVVYTDQYLCIDGKNLEQTRFQRNPPKNKMLFPGFVDYTPIHTSTVMLKKEVLDRVGKFNEELTFHEDSELWNRISNSYEFGYVTKPLGIYRWESNQRHMTNEVDEERKYRNDRLYLELYIKNKNRELTNDEIIACEKSMGIINKRI